MEENGAEDLRKVIDDPERYWRDSESWQHPNKQHNGQYFFEECQTKHSVSFGHDVEQLEEPDKRNGDEEVNERFSEQSHEYLLHSLHFLIFLLGEQDGLRDISPIQVSVMFVVVIMSVSPGVEGEVLVDAENFPDDGVHLHRLEEGEVSRCSGKSSERHAEGARPPRRQTYISVIFGLLSQSGLNLLRSELRSPNISEKI